MGEDQAIGAIVIHLDQVRDGLGITHGDTLVSHDASRISAREYLAEIPVGLRGVCVGRILPGRDPVAGQREEIQSLPGPEPPRTSPQTRRPGKLTGRRQRHLPNENPFALINLAT